MVSRIEDIADRSRASHRTEGGVSILFMNLSTASFEAPTTLTRRFRHCSQPLLRLLLFGFIDCFCKDHSSLLGVFSVWEQTKEKAGVSNKRECTCIS
jgi:hypothetical protein